MSTKSWELHQPVNAHKPGNAMLAAALAGLPEIKKDPRGTVYPMTCYEGGANQPHQASIFLRSVRLRTIQPSVVSAASHSQDSTHGLGVVDLLMSPYEPVGLTGLTDARPRSHGIPPTWSTDVIIPCPLNPGYSNHPRSYCFSRKWRGIFGGMKKALVHGNS